LVSAVVGAKLVAVSKQIAVASDIEHDLWLEQLRTDGFGELLAD
jgi:hypothetical protein